MIFEPFKPFLASAYQIKFATETWEMHGAAALRRQVFCEEQGLFHGDDEIWTKYSVSSRVSLRTS